MKKDTQITRFRELVYKDRINKEVNFEDLLIKDIERVIKDYFDIKDNARIDMRKEGNLIAVDISFLAQGIKNFGNLPE